MKYLIIATLVFFTAFQRASAQRNARDSALLQGDWEIENVNVELHRQPDDKLLERHTYATEKNIPVLNCFLPIDLVFRSNDVIVQDRESRLVSRFAVIEPDRILFFNKDNKASILARANTKQGYQPVPYMSLNYLFTNDKLLQVKLPASFYQDAVSKQQVKIICVANYRHKKA